MNKRLLKRQKRQVSRARARVKVSEPDVRTPEQIQAAREASRSLTARNADPHAFYSTPSVTKVQDPAGDARTKVDVGS
jgi:hypothetical protein